MVTEMKDNQFVWETSPKASAPKAEKQELGSTPDFQLQDNTVLFDDKLRGLFYDASIALGRLDNATSLLPDLNVFSYLYVLKEAVLSSKISGIHTSLFDLLTIGHGLFPRDTSETVEEVMQYVNTIMFGMRMNPSRSRVTEELISMIYVNLARNEPESIIEEGKQAIEKIFQYLSNLINNKATPSLEKAAFIPAQFYAISPLPKYNFRISRILTTLLLNDKMMLSAPLSFISSYFHKHKNEYHQKLNTVKEFGDWKGWLDFFSTAVIETAREGLETAESVHCDRQNDINAIEREFPRHAALMTVRETLSTKLISTIPDIAEQTGLTYPTVKSSLDKLIEMGIVRLVHKRLRNKSFVYWSYIQYFEE